MDTTQSQNSLGDVKNWIASTIESHRERAQPIARLGFPRLGEYFSPSLLAAAKFVPVDDLPFVPLTALGLPQYAEFEGMSVNAVTYVDYCFVQTHFVDKESLYFHELVHMTQWRLLGIERFILEYGNALIHGRNYHTNPFETMAYELQLDFDLGRAPFDVEREVARRIDLQFSSDAPAKFASK